MQKAALKGGFSCPGKWSDAFGGRKRRLWDRERFRLLLVLLLVDVQSGALPSLVVDGDEDEVDIGDEIPQLLARRGEDGLEAKLAEKVGGAADTGGVHLGEGLVEDDKAQGVVVLGVVGAAEGGEGGQDGDVERRLGLAAGLALERTAERDRLAALAVAADDQKVEEDVGRVGGEGLHVLEDLLPFLGLGRGGGGDEGEKVVHGALVLLHEELLGIAGLQKERIHDHVVILDVVLVRRDLELVGVPSEMAVGEGLVEFVDLGVDRLDARPELVDEIVLELADGSLVGLLDLLLVFGEHDLGDVLELLVELLVGGEVPGIVVEMIDGAIVRAQTEQVALVVVLLVGTCAARR